MLSDSLYRKYTAKKTLPQTQSRAQCMAAAAVIGLTANTALFLLKLLAGFAAHSISVIADSFNNLSDASSSVISLIGARLSGAPADKQHPFGHGRIEYLSALLVSLLIILVGAGSFYASIRKLQSRTLTEYSGIALVILLLSIAMKIFLTLFYRNLGKLLDSGLLTATAKDARNDVLVTVVTLFVMLFEKYFAIPADGIAGMVVSAFVIFSGLMIAKETVEPLIGAPENPELCRSITEIVENTPGILGTHDLIVHSYGPSEHIASVHAEVPETMSLLEAHTTVDRAERKVLKELGVQLVIHADPVAENDPATHLAQEELRGVLLTLSPDVTFHDFRVVPGSHHINLVFDLLVPYTMKEAETEALLLHISEEMQKKNPLYHCHINCDHELKGE